MAEELSSDSWGNALVLRVAGRIRDTRREQGYSVRELSERTQRLGHHVTRQVLVNLESGRRGVISLQDLFVIAHALGVNPLFLVFDHLQMGRPVEVLPGLLVPEWMALQWARSVPTSISSALYEEDFDSARGIISARERLDILESDIRALENRIGTLAHPEDSERAAEMRGTLAAHLAHRDSLRAILDRDGVQANAAWFDGGTLSQYRSTIWEPANSDG